MRIFISVILAAALLTAACGEAGENVDETTDTTAANDEAGAPNVPENQTEGESESPTTPPSSEPAPPSELPTLDVPATPVAVATDDLAARLGLAADAISLVLTEDVTWSDGSLGCPEPGMAYTQALVDGFRIVLAAGGVEYHYHAAIGSDPFYCANPSRPAAGSPGDA